MTDQDHTTPDEVVAEEEILESVERGEELPDADLGGLPADELSTEEDEELPVEEEVL